ncbi:MAG: zinc-ribbon domain-containing protein, partial [Candidatus Binataceae bacterium]
MNICKRCGRELEEDAAYCPKCGTRWMAQASQPVRRTARTRGDKIASLVVIGTLCIIAVVGGLYVASLPTAPINSESDSHSESAANPAAERGAPVPIAPVAITLSKTQDSALNALIRSALKNAQKDFFGEIVIKNNDFGVRTSGTALFLDMLGDSYALNCG